MVSHREITKANVTSETTSTNEFPDAKNSMSDLVMKIIIFHYDYLLESNLLIVAICNFGRY